MGKVRDLAKKDWQRITSAGGFETALTFEPPNASVMVTVNGFATKHHLGYDTETGSVVNSKNSHITVSEQLLVDEGYPVRNAAGDVSMIGHLVTFVDSTGTSSQYKVRENFPDETVGVITCMLDDFELAGYQPLTDENLVMFYDYSGLLAGEDNAYGQVESDGKVTSFKDLKGTAAYNLTQSVTTAKPLLAVNGIIFDGLNDFLSSADLPTVVKNSNDFTFVLVVEAGTSLVNRLTFQGAASRYIATNIGLGNSLLLTRNGGPNVILIEGTDKTDGETVVNVNNFEADWSIVSNGESDLSGSLTNTVFPIVSSLDAGRITGTSVIYSATILKSIMVWDETLTGTKLGLVNDYLTGKWLT